MNLRSVGAQFGVGNGEAGTRAVLEQRSLLQRAHNGLVGRQPPQQRARQSLPRARDREECGVARREEQVVARPSHCSGERGDELVG